MLSYVVLIVYFGLRFVVFWLQCGFNLHVCLSLSLPCFPVFVQPLLHPAMFSVLSPLSLCLVLVFRAFPVNQGRGARWVGR